MDPYSATDYVYLETEDGFVLHSVGPDGAVAGIVQEEELAFPYGGYYTYEYTFKVPPRFNFSLE